MLMKLRENEPAGVTRRRVVYAGRAGVTLLEVMIAMVVATIIMFTVLQLSRSTQRSWDTVRNDTNANFDLRRAAERIADELRQSAPAQIVVAHPTIDADTVTFKVPVGKALDVVLWGAEGNSGWSVQYVVENGQLIRRVLNALAVNAGMDQVLVNHMDNNLGGQQGFWVNLNGTMADIGVRAVVQSNGATWRKAAATSVLFRNE